MGNSQPLKKRADAATSKAEGSNSPRNQGIKVSKNRDEQRQQIDRDLAYTACFEPTANLVHPRFYGNAFAKLPADCSMRLPEDPGALHAIVTDEDVLRYILDWAKMKALSRANSIRNANVSNLVAETLYRLWAFLVAKSEDKNANGGPLCKRSLITLVDDGKLKTFADLADKINAISTGRPYREHQEQHRGFKFNHDDVHEAPVADQSEPAQTRSETEVKEIIAVRAFLYEMAKAVKKQIRLISKPGTSPKRHLAGAQKINNLRAEIAYQRGRMARGNKTRAEIAETFGACPVKMSEIETYTRRKLTGYLESGLENFEQKLGLNLSKLVVTHGYPATIIADLDIKPATT